MTSPSNILVTGVGLALPGAGTPADLLRPTGRPGEPVDPAARIGRRGLRYLDRASQLALCAARDALLDSALISADDDKGPAVDGASVAVVASSNLGNLDTVCEVASAISEGTTDRISPMALPNASSNVIASTVAMRFGLRGPNLMFCNGPTSGLDAVYWGAALVAAGRCSRAVVVGAETGNQVVRELMDEPARDLLDGAVALVVESREAARTRGARPIAELGRYARTAGVPECIEQVLADGDAPPGIWFSEQEEDRFTGTPLVADVPRHLMTGAHGLASGALGVLQCAAAVGWFGSGGTGDALLTNGDDGSDGVAGMLVRPVGGERW
ncbi:beta-ketoacyl synthase N-terminal-like domain-containing protein [Streptomyces abikoensis]|uniref:Beta-ketoacyl synthase N-terminal-like domain-containing protein n=1 Tax=Streptomyces abikoensis TaxID=97398 RepID=A0ABW7T085_9ACTN